MPHALPLLPGAAELARRGIASTLAPENLRLLERALGGKASGPWSPLLVDPQTSGGLLAGLPHARAGACLAALRDAGVQAAVIGEVVWPESPVRLFLE
ncbi:MAG: hypothetical protein JO264_20765 [Acidisphaera sp.]|nr:hypothetical protein [Acidisphaera sp.]